LALFCNIHPKQIFGAPNVDTIYQVPLLFHRQGHHLATTCLHLLNLTPKRHRMLDPWQSMVKNASRNGNRKTKIAVVGKYFATGDYQLVDSYVSVVEAVKHAAWKLKVSPQLSWIDSETIEKEGTGILEDFDGVIVPQGWGSRGTEGKIATIKYAREHKIPYLGLCFGMQMAVIEFGRNVLKLKNANTTEADPETPHPVIHVMPEQRQYLEKHQYGGTIRLGAYPCALKENSQLHTAYKDYGGEKNHPWNQPKDDKSEVKGDSPIVYERHRHR
jgi:CTP synthase